MKKNIYIKKKIINHLIIAGKKNTIEKILLKSIKELQKFSNKQSEKLIQLVIMLAMPVFKIFKRINKKRKKKIFKEIPTVILTKSAKISLAIKFILANFKEKKFDANFKTEILLNMGSSIQLKNKTQKFVLLKRFFFSYYKWR